MSDEPRQIHRADDETDEDLARTCPHCHEPPGKRCRDPSGRVRAVHGTRRNAAHRPKTGRPSAITPTITEAISDLLQAGNPLAFAAATNGVHPNTAYNWVSKGRSDHPDDAPYRAFREAVLIARAAGAAQHVVNIADAAFGGAIKSRTTTVQEDGSKQTREEYALPDWKASAFLLSTQFPGEFGKRTTVEAVAGPNLEPAADTGDEALSSLGADYVALQANAQRFVAEKVEQIEGPQPGPVVEGTTEPEASSE